MIKNACLTIALTAFALVAGCAAQGADETAPTPESDTLEQSATIYNGAFSATAYVPVTPGNWPNKAYGELQGRGTFSGPSARRFGICLLEMDWTPCNSVADCGSTPLPPGGFRYCTNIDNQGQKYCAFRPGSQTSFCAGTPAIAGNPPISPGYYATPRRYVNPNAWYVSYACFEGCAVSDPSVSSEGAAAEQGCFDNGVPVPCDW
jgi:hypothetical protein